MLKYVLIALHCLFIGKLWSHSIFQLCVESRVMGSQLPCETWEIQHSYGGNGKTETVWNIWIAFDCFIFTSKMFVKQILSNLYMFKWYKYVVLTAIIEIRKVMEYKV